MTEQETIFDYEKIKNTSFNFKLDSKIVIADEILFQMNAAHRTLGPKKVCFDFDYG